MWLRLGDANTRFFHSKASGRRKKNTIRTLFVNGVVCASHAAKADALRAHFVALLGTPCPYSNSFDWCALGLSQLNLQELDSPFSLDELSSAVRAMPADKAPGPDGFSGMFFHACWDVIKFDFSEWYSPLVPEIVQVLDRLIQPQLFYCLKRMMLPVSVTSGL